MEAPGTRLHRILPSALTVIARSFTALERRGTGGAMQLMRREMRSGRLLRCCISARFSGTPAGVRGHPAGGTSGN